MKKSVTYMLTSPSWRFADDYLVHMVEDERQLRYNCFNMNDKEDVKSGALDLDSIDILCGNFEGRWNAALSLVREATGLEIADQAGEVSPLMLAKFPMGKKILAEEGIYEDKGSIRFIDSSYNELFRIKNGGMIAVTNSVRTFSQKCKYIDNYHVQIGYDVYHICQYAEMVERINGKVQPEPICWDDASAWEIGSRAYLLLQRCDGGYDFTVYDRRENLTDGGVLTNPDLTANEARNEILKLYGWELWDIGRMDYEEIRKKIEGE